MYHRLAYTIFYKATNVEIYEEYHEVSEPHPTKLFKLKRASHPTSCIFPVPRPASPFTEERDENQFERPKEGKEKGREEVSVGLG